MKNHIAIIDQLRQKRSIKNGLDDVFEPWPVLQMLNVSNRSRAKIIDDNDIIASAQKPFGQMGADETRAAGNEITHLPTSFGVVHVSLTEG